MLSQACMSHLLIYLTLFLFHHPPHTEIYTLSLHDALPIFMGKRYPLIEASYSGIAGRWIVEKVDVPVGKEIFQRSSGRRRSEEHTSELQSQFHLVCRLLLEKKKKKNHDRQKKLDDSTTEQLLCYLKHVCPTSLSISLFFFFIIRRTPRSTLFPYTTLFRSSWGSDTRLSRRVTRASPAAGSLKKLTCRLGKRFFNDPAAGEDRKSTRLNSSHSSISYAVFCLKKKKKKIMIDKRSWMTLQLNSYYVISSMYVPPPYLSHSFSFSSSAAHRDLHSFPTRRSSDLHGEAIPAYRGELLGHRRPLDR